MTLNPSDERQWLQKTLQQAVGWQSLMEFNGYDGISFFLTNKVGETHPTLLPSIPGE